MLRDNLGEGNCESKLAAMQREVMFCAMRHVHASQAPLGGLVIDFCDWAMR